MPATTILVVLLILLLVGVFPTWGYSQSYGWGPSGVVGVLIAVIVVLILLGRI